MKPLDTPVVLLIFNRPDLTARIFREIARAKPRKLLVVADGVRPDHPEDSERCRAARAVVEQVNWSCEVLTNYADVNLGCRRRVASGLEWAFSEVEEAIILEDDCLPVPSFFHFCQELLAYYRTDERIMAISGNNFQDGQVRTAYSYYFSKYPNIWGWASWRRAWQHYDAEMVLWPECKQKELLKRIAADPVEVELWTELFEDTYRGRIDSWSYVWIFSCLIRGGLSITPECNLVTNIGFRGDATHTKNPASRKAFRPSQNIWRLNHPPSISRHREADLYTFDMFFGGRRWRASRTLKARLLRFASRVKRKLGRTTKEC